QPGSVVMSAATHQHVAGFFETHDLGELPVKGRAPVHAFEVLRPRSRRTRFDVAVGRGGAPLGCGDREVATLREGCRVGKGRGGGRWWVSLQRLAWANRASCWSFDGYSRKLATP